MSYDMTYMWKLKYGTGDYRCGPKKKKKEWISNEVLL